jgi:GNAT superfamily N-acetyltransferase
VLRKHHDYGHRTYVRSDRIACLRIFDENSPPFFAPEERALFDAFLGAPPCPYLVIVDREGTVVACGGYEVQSVPPTASLCWGMVQRDLHGKGIGQLLLDVRVAHIDQMGVSKVVIETSQYTAGFFEKSGFGTVSVTRDGFGPGIDCHRMLLSRTLPEAGCDTAMS